MVTRKPVPTAGQKAQQPPEPTQDPWSREVENGWEELARGGPRDDGSDLPEVVPQSASFEHLEREEENAWREARTQQPISTQNTGKLSDAPDVLRPGIARSREETNPFLRQQRTGSTNNDGSVTAPSKELASMYVSEPSGNPWQPALNEQATGKAMQMPRQESAPEDPWASEPRQQAPSAPRSPALISLSSNDDSPGWDDELPRPAEHTAPRPTVTDEDPFGDGNAWDDGRRDKGKDKAPADMQVGAGSAPPLPPRKDGDEPLPSFVRNGKEDMNSTYQIKKISWHDVKAAKNPRTSPILIQNENGPCPLVALVNALLLTTPAEIDDTALMHVLRSREQISLRLLLDAVFEELMSPRRSNPEVALPDVSLLYAFLKSLHTGMNVNPRFVPTEQEAQAVKRNSLTHVHPSKRGDCIPGTFENTTEMRLYATFSIPLIHGWLPPKEADYYASFERQGGSYEDIQNLLFREEELEDKFQTSHLQLSQEEQQTYQDILHIKSFLSMYGTQLTPYGIEVISESLEPGSVAILFRNDHFSTLYRHPQTLELLQLVTDAGYASHAEVVWESLADVNGEKAEFFSGDFRLVGANTEATQEQAQNNGSQWQTVQNRRPTRARSQSNAPPLSPNHEQEDRDLALALQLQEEEDERAREANARRQRESRLSEQFIEQQGRAPGAPGQPVSHGRRTSSVSVPVNTPNTGLRRPSQQPIRSLIPPTDSSRPNPARVNTDTTAAARPPQRPDATRRPADDGVDDAPPSYDEASKSIAYEPPPGHPAHPRSSLSSASGSGAPGRTPTSPVAGPSSGIGRGYPFSNRALPPQQTPGTPGAGRGRDKDCVVM